MPVNFKSIDKTLKRAEELLSGKELYNQENKAMGIFLLMQTKDLIDISIAEAHKDIGAYENGKEKLKLEAISNLITLIST